jgi:hypothetical protein
MKIHRRNAHNAKAHGERGSFDDLMKRIVVRCLLFCFLMQKFLPLSTFTERST